MTPRTGKRILTYLAVFGLFIVYLNGWRVPFLRVETLDIFEKQIAAQMPGFIPNPALLGDGFVVSDTITVDYLPDVKYSTGPREKLVAFIKQYPAIETPGFRLLVHTGAPTQEEYWAAVFPACSGAACLDHAATIAIEPIDHEEWDTHNRKTGKAITFATAEIRGVHHEAYVSLSVDRLGEVSGYSVYISRKTVGKIENFVQQLHPSGAKRTTISYWLASGYFLIK